MCPSPFPEGTLLEKGPMVSAEINRGRRQRNGGRLPELCPTGSILSRGTRAWKHSRPRAASEVVTGRMGVWVSGLHDLESWLPNNQRCVLNKSPSPSVLIRIVTLKLLHNTCRQMARSEWSVHADFFTHLSLGRKGNNFLLVPREPPPFRVRKS